jgi:hypothetical protein
VAQLYPQAIGFLFVTLHDSMGYSGDILTYLHTVVLILDKIKDYITTVRGHLRLQCQVGNDDVMRVSREDYVIGHSSL